jgi:hypothetical protein
VNSLSKTIMGYRVYYCNVLDDLKLNGWKTEDCLDPRCSHVEVKTITKSSTFKVIDITSSKVQTYNNFGLISGISEIIGRGDSIIHEYVIIHYRPTVEAT